MSVNRYSPHVFVIPEDDANRQIVNGFLLHHTVASWKVHVEPESGGWSQVLAVFEKHHAPEMSEWEKRFVILLIDVDEQAGRLKKAQSVIPESLRERVFVLGAWSEPERLKAELAIAFENNGGRMAAECNAEGGIWAHELLRHNASELRRLREQVCPFIFPL